MTELIHGDCLNDLPQIDSNSVDVILTDPPYKYLKNQKLEVDFDEEKFFSEAKRILKKSGFIVLFGRGASFYRWNTMLADLGFMFKEEFIWDKAYVNSPLMQISRVHETISVHTKKDGTINRVKVPYLEMKAHDFDSIITDIKRLKTVFNNTESLNAVIEYLENNTQGFTLDQKVRQGIQVEGHTKDRNRTVKVINSIKRGMNEKSIIRSDFDNCDKLKGHGFFGDRQTGDRCVNVVNGIERGMNEKSIIKIGRDHYATIHPTQKPVRLLERLLQLISKEGDLVLDPFAGSFSTAEACINLNRQFKGWEIDKQYFTEGQNRISEIKSRGRDVCLNFLEIK